MNREKYESRIKSCYFHICFISQKEKNDVLPRCMSSHFSTDKMKRKQIVRHTVPAVQQYTVHSCTVYIFILYATLCPQYSSILFIPVQCTYLYCTPHCARSTVVYCSFMYSVHVYRLYATLCRQYSSMLLIPVHCSYLYIVRHTVP